MSIDDASSELDHGARRLQGAMLEHPSLAIERMPGLSYALNRFIAVAPQRLASLIARPSGGAIEEVRATTVFQAVGECSGLTAAIYESLEPEARLLVALDERIDSLIVSSIFGEVVGPTAPTNRQANPKSRARRSRSRLSRRSRAHWERRSRPPSLRSLGLPSALSGWRRSRIRLCLAGGIARRRRRGSRSA